MTAYVSIPRSSLHHRKHLLHAYYCLFLEACDVYTLVNVFTDVQGVLLRVKQIYDGFIIDFEIAALNQVLELATHA